MINNEYKQLDNRVKIQRWLIDKQWLSICMSKDFRVETIGQYATIPCMTSQLLRGCTLQVLHCGIEAKRAHHNAYPQGQADAMSPRHGQRAFWQPLLSQQPYQTYCKHSDDINHRRSVAVKTVTTLQREKLFIKSAVLRTMMCFIITKGIGKDGPVRPNAKLWSRGEIDRGRTSFSIQNKNPEELHKPLKGEQI